jgi:hypothetical protein
VRFLFLRLRPEAKGEGLVPSEHLNHFTHLGD